MRSATGYRKRASRPANRRLTLCATSSPDVYKRQELDAARQRLGVLKELEKNMDGYQNSVKTVMRAASARRLRGIIGPVSSILSVEPGREVAIETALGGALQNIVAENEAAAKAGIALLQMCIRDRLNVAQKGGPCCRGQ